MQMQYLVSMLNFGKIVYIYFLGCLSARFNLCLNSFEVCPRGLAVGGDHVPALPVLLLRQRRGQPHQHGRNHHQQVS